MTELDMETIVYMFGYEDAFSVSRLAQTLNDDYLDIDIDTLYKLLHTHSPPFPPLFV